MTAVAQPVASERTARERKLRAAFAEMLAEDGWCSTLEALGAELDAHADEAAHWSREMWAMRSKAMFDLSDDKELR